MEPPQSSLDKPVCDLIFEKMQAKIEQNGHTKEKINFIFYYSGHARKESFIFSKSNGYLRADEIKARIHKLNPTRSLFILDCCWAAAMDMSNTDCHGAAATENRPSVKSGEENKDFYICGEFGFPKLWNISSGTKGNAWSCQWSACTDSQKARYSKGNLSYFTEYIFKGMCGAESLCHISEGKTKSCPGCECFRQKFHKTDTNKVTEVKLGDLEEYIKYHVSTKKRKPEEDVLQEPVMDPPGRKNVFFMTCASTRLFYELDFCDASLKVSKIYYRNCKDEKLQSTTDFKKKICKILQESYELPCGVMEFLKPDHLQFLPLDAQDSAVEPDILSLQQFFNKNKYPVLKVCMRSDIKLLKEDLPVTVLFDKSEDFNKLCDQVKEFAEKSQQTCIMIKPVKKSQENRSLYSLEATPPYAEDPPLPELVIFDKLINGAFVAIKKAPPTAKYTVQITLDFIAMAAELRVCSEIIKNRRFMKTKEGTSTEIH